MSLKRTTVIVDLQFGSTGKGLLAGFLARQLKPDTVVCAFGPNAGHTFVDEDGTKLVHTMLPISAISPNLERIMIGPGAVIDEPAMFVEVRNLEALGYEIWSKLFIHENAAVVGQDHREAEKAFQRIGSTSKGTAEAMIQKMRRDPTNLNIARQLDIGLEARVVDADTYDAVIDQAEQILAEGAQGFSLGINQRFYPHATSRECTAWQVLTDCGVPAARNEIEVVGSMRTFPIRVANRPEGTSGGCYPDQEELSFEQIGVPQEYTTVTKLPRRIFSFSMLQLEAALRANDCGAVFLNFCNYIKDEDAARYFINDVRNKCHRFGTTLKWLGFGPRVTDIKPVWGF